MEDISLALYKLAPHSAIELNTSDVALMSTETRGWAIVSILDYCSIKAILKENIAHAANLHQKFISAFERLHKLGLMLKDGLYPDYCRTKSSTFPDSLLIKMTGQCNFECIYCYDFSSERKKNNIPIARIISIIDQIVSKTGRLNIIFHGGEPLLRINTIKDIIDYCNNNYANIKIKYSIQTNGALLNDKIVGFLDTNNFSVGISLDGIWADTDLLRKSKGNLIEPTSQMFKSHLIKYNDFIRRRCGILTVLCRSSIKNLPDFIMWLQDNGIAGFSATILDPTGRAASMREEALTPQDIVTVYRQWLDMIISGKVYSLRIQNLLVYLDNLCSFDPPNFCRKGPCGAGREFLVLDSDGSLRACDCIIHDCFRVGGKQDMLSDVVKSEFIPNTQRRSEWLLKYFACSECAWYQLCGGTCMAKALGVNDNIYSIYPMECELTKFLYPFILKEYAENQNSNLFTYYRRSRQV